MANAGSTAGFRIKYLTRDNDTSPGSLSGWHVLEGGKAVPAVFNDPNTLQTTPLSETKNHSYIDGMADSGGAIAVTVNDYTAFRTSWADVLAKYRGAVANGNYLWFELAYPKGSDLPSCYFVGKPLPYGFGGSEVDAVLENNAIIVPQGDYVFSTASRN